MFHLIVFPLGLSRFVTPGRSNVQDMKWNSTTTQNKFQVFWQENSHFRIITENKFLVKIIGNIFNFLVQGKKIRKFQFDKKETCVSKLLMKFTHTHKIWFGEGKIQTIQLFGKPSYYRIEWHLAKFCKRYISISFWSSIACLQTECVFATVF